MFIGHYAVALASKKAAPRTSLGTLFLSAQFIDLLWPIFLLIGLEHVRIDPGNTPFTPLDFYDYPVSHSLLAVLGWAAAFALVYYFLRHDRRAAWVLAAGVVSHWVLDLIAHRPDLPIAPGIALSVGLGLWQSVAATLIVEAALFGIGVWLYVRTTESIDRIGTYSFWVFIVVTLLLYALATFGEPPPNQTATAIGALSQWLVVPWIYWFDRHRRVKADKRTAE